MNVVWIWSLDALLFYSFFCFYCIFLFFIFYALGCNTQYMVAGLDIGCNGVNVSFL